jgi:hypothetical protein
VVRIDDILLNAFVETDPTADRQTPAASADPLSGKHVLPSLIVRLDSPHSKSHHVRA